MQLHELQSFVNHQITQLGRGAQSGRLDGSVPRSVSNQIDASEQRFADAILEKVRGISLNHHEMACLLPRVGTFKLEQGKGQGEVILSALKTHQLTFNDAKLLLDAAVRQQSTALPTHDLAAPLPPKRRPPNRGAEPLPYHDNTTLAALRGQMAGREVDILSDKPAKGGKTLAIWPSASKPGQFGVNIPDQGLKHAANMDQAKSLFDAYALRQQTSQIKQRWGEAVAILSERSSDSFPRPAIWPSASKLGAFGAKMPGEVPNRYDNLDQANAYLAARGVEPRLSNGDRIQVTGTHLPEASRVALAQKHQIVITPIIIQGKEIAYLFRGQQINKTFFFSSHGNERSQKLGLSPETFTKPEGIAFKFPAPRHMKLASKTMMFAEHLKDDKVKFDSHESQIYDSLSRQANNYVLGGGINTQPEDAAELIGRMNREKIPQPFDFVLLNREAKGVRFADLLQGLRDTLGETNMPSQLVCHFCRPQGAHSEVFNAKENYRG